LFAYTAQNTHAKLSNYLTFDLKLTHCTFSTRLKAASGGPTYVRFNRF